MQYRRVTADTRPRLVGIALEPSGSAEPSEHFLVGPSGIEGRGFTLPYQSIIQIQLPPEEELATMSPQDFRALNHRNAVAVAVFVQENFHEA